MSDPFIAEIKIFAGNFAPRGWAFCDGQLLPIAQNTALFSLIGTTYGGDGRTTTALPNLQGRAPMHPGRGPGLSQRRLGQNGGVETVTLSESQLTPHSHRVHAGNAPASSFVASSNSSITRSVGGFAYNDDPSQPLSPLHETALSEVGADADAVLPHQNMQPYLAMYFIIALVGVFPSRS
jgi:microcystin-dependent protein